MSSERLVFLTGFSGSGKSTVGALLAKRLRLHFIDVDREIEREAGCSIAVLFESRGEEVFRRMEKKVVERMAESPVGPVVIALGGGALLDRSVRQSVGEHGTLVYLRCSVRELLRRLSGSADRPLLRVRLRAGETVRRARIRRIRALLKKRLPGYRQAHIIISTSRRTPAETTRELARRLRNRHAAH